MKNLTQYVKFAKVHFSNIENPVFLVHVLCDALLHEFKGALGRQDAIQTAIAMGVTYNTASTQYNTWKNKKGATA